MRSLSRHLSERNIPKLYIPVISLVSLECKIKLQNNNIYVSKISVAKSDHKTNRRDIPKTVYFLDICQKVIYCVEIDRKVNEHDIPLLCRVRVMVLSATFANISAISWRSYLLVEETRVLGENHRPAASH